MTASGTWSENESSVDIDSVDDLDRFVEYAEAKCTRPSSISIEVHGYRVDLLVGHGKSFVHMTPEDFDDRPYFVTLADMTGDGVDYWLHSWHHSWIDSRHLVDKSLAREAFREFFRTGKLSTVVKWEQYTA
jgi:Immunity protein Imm1